MLLQASEAMPGQRAVRFPWQEPTLGERAAATLDALADASVEAEDRLAAFNDQSTRRVQDAKRTTGEAMADAASSAQETAQQLGAQAADQATDLRETTNQRARLFKRRASERGAAAAEIAAQAQRALGEQFSAARLQGARLLAPGDANAYQLPPDLTDAADRAARSAERAELASQRAVGAASQIAGALDRILQARGDGNLRAVVEQQKPAGVEIRVGDAAESPLNRAADAVARVLAAAGGTLYDYSDGQYGLQPVGADDLRRERKREKRNARPVAIIEGRYAGEKAPKPEKQGSRVPMLLGGLALVGAAVGVAYTQRDRFRPLFDQVMAQVQGLRDARTPRTAPRIPSGPPSPTPAFNRVVSGQLIETPSPALSATATRARSATTSATSATTPTVTQRPSASSSDGAERAYVAGEPTQVPPQP
jgi:hypothetical protein